MRIALALGPVILLGACVSVPTGPAVMVLPGSSKTFEQFRADDWDCRQYASIQVGGGTPESVAESSGVKSAAIGTVVGAAAGALIGGKSGAGAGAGAGLLMGSAMGAGAAGQSQYSLQNRYDIGYQQCMYARGHQIPTAGSYGAPHRPATSYAQPAPPQASSTIPPPPPGAPPPAPPGNN